MKKIFLTILIITAFLIYKPENAKAQTCTVTPPTNTGTVTLSADATAGTYRVWSRMKAADSTNNSFYLKIDSGCPVLVQNPSTSWTWTANANNETLTAGTHVVTIIGNQPGVGVDKLLMTKNLTCVPTGTSGDNCPAEVVATPTIGATDNNPPVITNINASNVTATTATINWNLDEYGSGQVEYGTTASYGQISALQTCCTYNYHIQTLSGLSSGVTYHYRVKSADQFGNMAVSNDCTFITGGATTTFTCSNTGSTPTPTISPTKTPTPTLTPTLTPTKTPTPTISPTLVPNSTVLRFNSVKLHGIGTGGDNTNPNLSGNTNPTRTSRILSVELIDSAGNTLPATTGNVVYKPTTGDFSGDITLDPTIPTGSYLVKVKSSQYLKRQLVGIINVTKATVNTLPGVSLVTGDINNDNALTIADYNLLIDCYSDLLPAKNCSDSNKKASADLSDDGNVNASDYNLFLRELSVVSGN